MGLVTRFGRFARAVDPGLVKVNPLSERLIQIDVKIQIVGKYILQKVCDPVLMSPKRYRARSV